MSLDPAPPHRLLRAALLALVMTGGGCLTHIVAGGSGSTGWAAVCGALLLGPAWLLTGRERGWTAIAGAQLAGQQVVHLLLGLGAAHAAMPAPDVMVYLHVIMAALIAVWLRHGERRAWAAARRAAAAVVTLWRALVALFERPVPARPFGGPPETEPVRQPPWVLLRHSVVRRGPPAAA